MQAKVMVGSAPVSSSLLISEHVPKKPVIEPHFFPPMLACMVACISCQTKPQSPLQASLSPCGTTIKWYVDRLEWRGGQSTQPPCCVGHGLRVCIAWCSIQEEKRWVTCHVAYCEQMLKESRGRREPAGRVGPKADGGQGHVISHSPEADGTARPVCRLWKQLSEMEACRPEPGKPPLDHTIPSTSHPFHLSLLRQHGATRLVAVSEYSSPRPRKKHSHRSRAIIISSKNQTN